MKHLLIISRNEQYRETLPALFFSWEGIPETHITVAASEKEVDSFFSLLPERRR